MNIGGKTIEIFQSAQANAPLVIYNSFSDEGETVYKECQKLGCPVFNMAAISNLNWDDDMSPWAIPPISKNDTPCGGKADEYLDMLNSEIIPNVLGELDGNPAYIAVAGYSLAGLFALYSAFNCDTFSAVASASGSMWLPDFVDYVKNSDISKLPKTIYFSLGDKESKVRNKILHPVEDNTREICGYLSQNGINTIFELNKGNHYQDAALRMAKGIRWILENMATEKTV